ncbi:MAG TPA: hypothetical protein DHW64_07960 [Chitinophagaceae bacterium]|nr:hypothetical protein [Chitinophagaceae bacterium]
MRRLLLSRDKLIHRNKKNHANVSADIGRKNNFNVSPERDHPVLNIINMLSFQAAATAKRIKIST